MSIFNTLKRIAFADNDTALLHSTQIPYAAFKFVRNNTAVAVWDLNSYSLRFTCPGILIGKSQDGTTFLTHYPPHTDKPERAEIKGWNAKTGEEIPIDEIDPDSYTFQQKTVAFIDQRAGHCPRIVDVLDGRLSQPIQFVAQNGSYERADSCAISPDGTYLLATVRGEGGGHDWMHGTGVSLRYQGKRISLGNKRVTFKVNRHQSDVLFDFSEIHNLFGISDGNSSLAIYDSSDWRHIFSLQVANFRHQVAFHPQDPFLLAVNTETFSPGNNKKSFHIQIIEPERTKTANRSQHTVAVRAVLEETGFVHRLLFHPDGTHLASLLGGVVHWWDVEKQERKAIFQVVP